MTKNFFFIFYLFFLNSATILAQAEQLIDFSFKDEDLTTIINLLAAKRGVNVVLPQGANAINQKITFTTKDKLTVNEAWKILLNLLEISGYSLLTPKAGDNALNIVKNDRNVFRQPTQVIIGSPDKIPQTDQHIFYVHYLQNIKVPENTASQEPLNMVLKDLLSPNGVFLYDPKSNGIIIADNANSILSAIRIISEFDSTGFREVVEVVPLFYSNASTIAKILKDIIPPAQDNRFPLRSGPKTEAGLYFNAGTKVIPIETLNRLIIMGKDTAVSRVKDFITEYIDRSPESGKSILHYYQLQYLEAKEFAGVLSQVVKPVGAAAQTQAVKETAGGPERYFEGVIILPEEAKPRKEAEAAIGAVAPADLKESTAPVYQGGNRLIVAARENDWIRIRDLIKKLDQPQPQVILEVLILDVTKDTDKAIRAEGRNKNGLLKAKGVDYLLSHATAPLNVLGNPPINTLAADLLQFTQASTPQTFLNNLRGPTVFSFNDSSGSGIWQILEVLDSKQHIKVLSHPYLVTSNNRKAYVESVEIRRDQAGEAQGTSGTAIINVADLTAKISVAIVPRISSLNRVNLKIDLYIEEFVSPIAISTDLATLDRRSRSVSTNSNLQSGNVLALGGLIQETENTIKTQTPLLSHIPIIGWLFKSTEVEKIINNLVIFICPTIVDPRLRAGQERFTTDKIRQSNKDLSDKGVFDERDPITRWFFTERNMNEDMIDEYVLEAKNTTIKPADYKRKTKKDLQKSLKKTRAQRKPVVKPIEEVKT